MVQKLIVLMLAVCISSTAQAAVTAKDLVRKVDAYRGFPNSPFMMNLGVFSRTPGKKDRKYKLMVRVRDEKSIVQFLAPARDKGRTILKDGNNMWLHVPRTRKIIRISATQRLLGEASNGDVASVNMSQDYTPEIIGEEDIEGIPSYRLLLKAVHRKVTYHKIDLWVSKKDGKPVMSKHYAVSGKLLKSAYYKEFQKTKYGEKLSKLLLVDPLKKGKFTWMIYSQYQKTQFPNTLFRKENLSRL